MAVVWILVQFLALDLLRSPGSRGVSEYWLYCLWLGHLCLTVIGGLSGRKVALSLDLEPLNVQLPLDIFEGLYVFGLLD